MAVAFAWELLRRPKSASPQASADSRFRIFACAAVACGAASGISRLEETTAGTVLDAALLGLTLLAFAQLLWARTRRPGL
jgi:hypothetical protein